MFRIGYGWDSHEFKAGIPLKIGGRIDSDNQAYYDEVIRLRLHSRRVEYVGEVLERDKPEFLGNAVAALYFPHPDEPAGQTVIESLACGTPVIAANSGGVTDIVRDGETGLLVPERDPAALADALQRLLALRDVQQHEARDRHVDRQA